MWDDMFEKYPKFCLKEPDKDVVDFAKLIGSPRDKKIYDLGFGAGRHVVFFSKLGYQMFGGDKTKSGTRITEEWLNQEGLTAELIYSDMTEIPYKDNFFDGIVCNNVISHNIKENIMKCISEIYRTLKPKGLVFITFISTESSEYGKGKFKEPNTYITESGPEEGILHYFVTKEEVEEMMKDFKEISLTHLKKEGLYMETVAHWIFIGKKK